jgi:hypothetical protein
MSSDEELTADQNIRVVAQALIDIIHIFCHVHGCENNESLNELKSQLYKLKEMKSQWITDCLPGFTSSTFTGKSLITNRYYVQFKNGKYSIIQHPGSNKVYSCILWSENTATQCIIDLYCDNIDELDDNYIEGNLAKLVNIADDWESIERPMIIDYIDEYRYDILN